MKISPAPDLAFPLSRGWRRARRIVAVGVGLALAAGSAWAQVSVSTLAGTAGSAGGADGTGAAAGFNRPAGIAVDTSSGASVGTIYVADTASHTIRKITSAGVVTTLAGFAGNAGSSDANGTSARFRSPEGVALDSTGANLYVADSGNSTIRKITLATGEVTTIAGRVGTFSSAEGTGTAAQFNGPTGLVVGPGDTHLYIADIGNQTIRQIVLATGVVSTFAGSTSNPGAVNGTGAAARFFLPRGLAADATNLYVADSGNHTIRAIVLASGAVTTLAGSLNADVSGTTDATGTAARFKSPGAVAVRGATLYVADGGNSTVRSVALGSGAVTTVAGSAGTAGSADGTGVAARFAASSPLGIAVDRAGNFYTADTGNHTIRKAGGTAAPAIAAQPANASAAIAGTATFTVSASGNPTPTFQWQRQPGGTGSFANLADNDTYSGATTSQLTIASVTAAMGGDKFRCVITNSAGTVTSDGATLTVTQGPVFTSAASTAFSVGLAGSFQVTAAGSPAPTFAITTLNSSLSPSNAGVSLSSTGLLYGVPGSTVGSPYQFTVTATNSSGTATQLFTLLVQNGASIVTQPTSQSIASGANASFSAVAGGTPSTYTYQWSRQAAGTTPWVALANGTVYSGVNSATLMITAATAAMNGDQFQCSVSNGVGVPALTIPVVLTVTVAPAFTSTASATFGAGVFGSYQLQATGSPAPTFSITAGTSPSAIGVTLSPTGLLSGNPTATTGSPFNFSVTATNSAGTASQTFTLTVVAGGALPGVTTHPANQSVIIGQAATFSVVGLGTPAPTYQWHRQAAGTAGFVNLASGGAYSGATTATLTITGAATGMSGDLFQCVLTNTAGTATSSSASLTVNLETIVTAFAGAAGSEGATDGAGTAARFSSPSAIVIDRSGNLFVSQPVSSIIRKITPAGVVTTYAGVPGVAGSTDGPAATARFNGPYGLALDPAGNLYVADTFNHTIRVISTAGQVTTLAGLAGTFGAIDDTGTAARFAYPTSVAVTPTGHVYVADSFNHTIRLIAPGGAVSTYAGQAGQRGSVDGSAMVGGVAGSARFSNPSAVTVDAAGNVYVADTFNHTVRKISTVSTVSTLAGQAGTAGSTDGTGGVARFNQPNGLTIDAAGTLFVADTFNHLIRKVTGTGVVTTLAGAAGASGSTDGTGAAARFFQPYGIAVDSAGNFFVADSKNHLIRRNGSVFTPTITTQPFNRGAAPGQTATFTIAATGIPTPIYQWQRQAAAATTGFANLANDATYSGVTTATLTVTNVTTAMGGDLFRCVVTNYISPEAISNTVTLTTAVVAPAFTSAASANFTVGQAGSVTVAATGTPAPVFRATGLPSWAALNATTGVLSGTPPNATGAPFAITLTADNGTTASQSFTLNVLVPAVAPTITGPQVALVNVDRGATADLTIAATGTAPLSYQWSKDGVVLTGATAATLTLANAQAGNAGAYSVRVSNVAGSIASAPIAVNVRVAPTITTQPRSQTALAGGAATFGVTATGGLNLVYQWRFNGVAIPGATSSTLTLPNVQPANAGNYDVVVGNPPGTSTVAGPPPITSALAQFTVTAGSAAPVIVSAPASRTALVGSTAAFTVVATGVPAPVFQWRKDGALLPGATHATLSFAGVQLADTANYDVIVTNAAGGIASPAVALKVITRSYAGVYVGAVSGNAGNFALLVRADNTATLLCLATGASGGNLSHFAVNVTDAGGFTYAVGETTVSGAIANNGAVSATVSGSLTATLTGTKSPDIGAAQALAGFYQAGVAGGSGAAYAIVSATGQLYAFAQSRDGTDGGLATLDSANRATIATASGSLAVTLAADGSTLTVNALRGTATTVFAGASEALLATQRLGNISSRARVDAGSNIAIAGFVISGTEAKPVLIRAIGPTLASFGVGSALANPKLELFRGATAIASNTGWTTAGNTAAVVAATAQAGAFPLGATSADSVIFATLPPGAYTAQVSAASGAAGIALIEVYDLSAAAAGQKLFNISTRATAGAGEAMLIAGLSINGTVPKRVLIRAIGPGLAQFGLSSVLAAPQLQLVKDGTVVAANTGLATSPDAAAIAVVSAQVGAFALPANSADCALLVNLAPGNYNAVVSASGTATGLAIVEVYEVP